MSGTSPDILMDPVTGDLPAFARHVSGMEIIAQRVRIRLTTLLGDWPLKRAAGIDWIGILGTKPFDAEAATAVLVLEMVDTPGVTGVSDVEFSQAGDTYTITATLLTEVGENIAVRIDPQGFDGNPSITVGGVLGHARRIIG